MKSLGHLEYRCAAGHEPKQPGCAGCGVLALLEREADLLRQRRSALMARVRKHLGSREIIIVDVK